MVRVLQKRRGDTAPGIFQSNEELEIGCATAYLLANKQKPPYDMTHNSVIECFIKADSGKNSDLDALLRTRSLPLCYYGQECLARP